jgi:predicted nucleotidyltransferase
MREILRVVYGSHLFGTEIEGSDLDCKVVYIPSPENILLQRTRHLSEEEQQEAAGRLTKLIDVRGPNLDIEYITLQRFLDLLTQGQTLALDMFFAPEEAHIGDAASEWLSIKANAQHFISSDTALFLSFAESQLRKYEDRSDRLGALEAATAFFQSMAALHNPTARVAEVQPSLMGLMCEYPTDLMSVAKIESPGRQMEVVHFECCGKKVPFGASLKEAASIYRRAGRKYGERVRKSQSMGGTDWKALYHAVRIVREAEELLLTGKIIFPRPEAKLLLSIRSGTIDRARVLSEIEVGLKAVKMAEPLTNLRKTPDRERAEGLTAAFYRSEILRHGSMHL